MAKILGSTTTYHGSEHPYLRGCSSSPDPTAQASDTTLTQTTAWPWCARCLVPVTSTTWSFFCPLGSDVIW
jgi:hypothetical protein